MSEISNVDNSKYKIIDFISYGDERGFLTVFQKDCNLPFTLKRAFYSYQIPFDARRGGHANRISEFVLISVAGSCTILVDDGVTQKEFILDSPTKGLYLNKMVWKEMYNFSKDNVLLVLSSCEYVPDEYVKDYEQFKKEITR